MGTLKVTGADCFRTHVSWNSSGRTPESTSSQSVQQPEIVPARRVRRVAAPISVIPCCYPDCKQVFEDAFAFALHGLKEHGGQFKVKSSIVRCRFTCFRPGCDSRWRNPAGLARHACAHHLVKIFACEQCGLRYRKDKALEHFDKCPKMTEEERLAYKNSRATQLLIESIKAWEYPYPSDVARCVSCNLFFWTKDIGRHEAVCPAYLNHERQVYAQY